MKTALIARRRRQVVGGDPIAAIFADGTDGFWFDFGEAGAVGTSNVGSLVLTAEGETVGIVIDKHHWGGLSLDAYLATIDDEISDPEFDTGTGWLQTNVGSVSAPIHDGVADIERVDASNYSHIRTSFTTVADGFYRVSWIKNSQTGDLGARVGSTEYAFNILNGPILDEYTLEALYFTPGVTTTYLQILSTGNLRSLQLESFSVKNIGGYKATQSNGSYRPDWLALGGAYFDNTATEHLVSTKAPGSGANTLIAHVVVPSAPTGVTWFMGAQDAAGGRLGIGVNASGHIVGMCGNETETTIKGSTDLSGESAVIQLNAPGNGETLTLYVDGVAVYSGTQDGAPTTTQPLYIGANNNNGTAAGHLEKGYILQAVQANKDVV